MVDGNFIVVPLAEDGKIAIGPGRRTVGVRVRLMGTGYSETLVDPESSYYDLVVEAKRRLKPFEEKMTKSVVGFRDFGR